MELLDGLDPLLKTFWLIAIPVSVIFVIQSIMTFIGADASDGIDADFDSNLEGESAPFQLFSFRNLINFLLGFSWSGISFYTSISNKSVLIGISILIGLLFVALFFLMIQQLLKLSENNSFKISDCINKTAEVYLTIPENKNGKGKVLVSINGSTHELYAISLREKIETGSIVKVVSIENDSLLIVELL